MADNQRDLKSFNLGAYFNEGHTVADFNPKYAPMSEIRREDFVLKNGLWQASWSNKKHTDEVPEYMQDFVKELAQSGYYDWFTQIYGQFTQRTVALYKWDTDTQVDWRSDASMGSFLSTFVFLGEGIGFETAGEFRVGSCDADAEGGQVPDTLKEMPSTTPIHGRAVTLYNMNPTVVYAQDPMLKKQEMYVVALYLGYIENTLMRAT